MRRCRLLVSYAVALAGLVAVPSSAAAQQADANLVARARAIHERVITLDTHVDIDPRNFVAGPRDYAHALGSGGEGLM